MQTVQNIEQLKERKRILESQRKETIKLTYDLLKKISDGGKQPEMPTVLRVGQEIPYISEITKFIFTNSNIRKLQEWTGKRFTNVLFDSKNGIWSQGYSQFHNTILGDRHLIIAIVDINGNMFVGYVSGNITQQNHCGDQSTFLFKLPSEKNKYMCRYLLRDGIDGNVFYIYNDEADVLFTLGDITVGKKGCNNSNRFIAEKFDYMNQNFLPNGDIEFQVDRIVVAEMVDP